MVWKSKFLSPIFGVTRTADGYLAVGEDGFMMTSQDGTSWQEFGSDSLQLPGYHRIVEAALGGDVVVAGGTDGVIISSKNGLGWVRQPTVGPGHIFSMKWIDSEFWATADHGILRSPNGTDWELMLHDPDVHLFEVAWNGTVFVAVGFRYEQNGSVALVATSTDGFDWTYEWIDAGAGLTAVCWTGELFVAVGDYGVHLTSPDGLTWTQHPRNEDIIFYDLEWNGQRLVAVGRHLTAGKWILSSTDGVHWDTSNPPGIWGGGFTDVMWTGVRFITVDRTVRDTFFTSTNGLEWSIETTGTGLGPETVAGDENTLYLIGTGGKIIRRIDPEYLREPRRPAGRVWPSIGNGKKRATPMLEK